MTRSVLLLHRAPGQPDHYDWLFEAEIGAPSLTSFRVWARLDQDPGSFEAEEATDHRREYLEYEGEISRGRGHVERVAEGEVEVAARPSATSGDWRVRVRLGEIDRWFRGTRAGQRRWVFRADRDGEGSA